MLMEYLIVGLFILLDFATGLIKAIKEKGYSSTIMREGLYHKCGSILCVAFGALVDYAQTLVDIGVNIPVSTSICVYIIVMEIGSVIENLCAINPSILPEKIKSFFAKINGNKDKGTT